MTSNIRGVNNKVRERGVGMVEFALALPMLLLVILGILEASRWFQSFLAVQYAAREAARFAVTGQPAMYQSEGPGSCQEIGIPVTGSPYNLPNDYIQCRVDHIKAAALNLAKLGVLADPAQTDITKPRYLGVFVRGSPTFGAAPVTDNPGVARSRVEVQVVYNHPVMNPFLAMLLPTIRVVGVAEMINEPWIGGGPDVPPAYDPPDPLPPLDTDGDGWSDVQERDVYGTLPNNSDTDGDGIAEGPGGDLDPLDPCIPIACEAEA